MAFILALLIASPQADQHPASTIDSAALYLNKAYFRLQQLRLEADRTGNHVKLKEYEQELKDELAAWDGKKVTWLMQVESVGAHRGIAGLQPSKHDHFIKLVENYSFKNKSQLQVIPKIKSDFERTNNNNFPVEDSIAFDEAWAKTLKRGDWIVVEGVLSEINLTVLYLQPSKYSKYTPPKKK